MKSAGGYVFKNLQGEPASRIKDFGVPEMAVFPLRRESEDSVKITVRPGERVEAGQVIARRERPVAGAVPASISGTVKKITPIGPNFAERAIFIEGDGSSGRQQVEGYNPEWTAMPVKDLERVLYLSGVTAQGKHGIPTSFKTAPVMPDDIKHIIISVVEDNPYNPRLSVLLQETGTRGFVEGLKILKKIIPEAIIHLALNENRGQLIKNISPVINDFEDIRMVPLEPRYPQGQEQMLINTLLKQDFAPGEKPLEKGILILDGQAIVKIYEAAVKGRPDIDRIIPLSGPGWKENFYIRVRLGTPLEAIINKYLINNNDESKRIIINNIMTGSAVRNYSLPVTRRLNNLIAVPENDKRELFSFLRPGVKKFSYTRSFLASILPDINKSCDTNIHGEQRPCIFCKYCQQVCPVDIIPHLLDKYLKRSRDYQQLRKYGIFDCIECNLCNFVCPAKIPLANHIKQGQKKLQTVNT